MQNPSLRGAQSMLTYQDLVNDMAAGCKPRESWRIGTEHEQFVYNLKTGAALPYDGSDSGGPGILQIIQGLIDQFGWTGSEKNGYLVELKRDGAYVMLEPGGQIEIASAPLLTLAALKEQTTRFYTELAELGQKLGFGIMARGFHPNWTRRQIHWMPKERYQIMGPYMAARSNHGVDMMILTCGAQINLDFSSEADMVKKYRVALGLQPFITALMANSNLAGGQDSGYRSFRSFIWTETDPDRCGVPEFVFEADMSFARYVDYALNVPMYLILRDGKHINVLGQSFRDFMTGTLKGQEGEYATLEDWRYHLTTLFPEVRLKSYLEFRGPDSTDPPLVYAMSAFWTGLMYNDGALDEAATLIASWSGRDHTRIRSEVPKFGLDTVLPGGKTWRDIASELLAIAENGLKAVEPGAADDLAAFKAFL